MPSISVHGYKIKSGDSPAFENLQTDFNTLKATLAASVPAAHNEVGKLKNITADWNDIHTELKAGNYSNIYLGDQIVKNNRTYLIAGCGCRIGQGNSTIITEPNLDLITDASLGDMQMNDTNITTGAYVGSKAFTANLQQYINMVIADWGSDIIIHDALLSTSVDGTTGKANNWAWQLVAAGKGRYADLMNYTMVYGDSFGHPIFDAGIDSFQLPLFEQMPSLRNCTLAGNSFWYWLRNIYSAAAFGFAGTGGYPRASNASGSGAVRLHLIIR